MEGSEPVEIRSVLSAMADSAGVPRGDRPVGRPGQGSGLLTGAWPDGALPTTRGG